ncbi:MAG: helix-turn-helix domain-containing protein [Lachnospiraceae bacterium]|nr:helix-turn-helix domain-containing protein [Lachnospiraceae bacterium]
MYIDMEILRQQLGEYECTVYMHDYTLCLDMIENLNGAIMPYFQHTLYLADSPKRLKDLKPVEYMNILVMNPQKKDLSGYTHYGDIPVNILDVHAPAGKLAEIANILRSYFDDQLSTGLFGDSLINILFHEQGIQAMIDKIAPAFNNPVYLFDSGFNLLACNYEEAEKTPMGKKIIEAMGFTDEEYKLINAHGHIHERVKKQETPLRVFHKEIGYEQVICTISTKKDMGHLVIDGVNRPITDSDIRLLYMLKMGISQQMQKNEFIRNNSGYPYEYLLRDLLDEKIGSSANQSGRFNYVNHEFSKNKYCMVIEAARTNDTLNLSSLRSKFESLLVGTKTLHYNGQIIVIFSFPDKKYLGEKEFKLINALCVRENLFAGLSNVFTDIIQFRGYYEQSLRAIEIGAAIKNTAGLYAYKDYYLQHMANTFTSKESFITYCHPKLKTLLEHDQKNDTELAYTLYLYLVHERRSQEAADALNIHRNTLSYRLKMIDSLVDIDYEDYKERQYIILSYELFKLNYQPDTHELLP